jgi:hypothetical protein
MEAPLFSDTLTNITVGAKGSKSVLDKTLGHKKLCITLMPSLLANGTKVTPFVMKRNSFKRKILVKLYLNIMRQHE